MTEIGSQPPELLGGDTAEDEPLSRMTLIGHLEELRRRIIHSLVAVLLGFFVCWGFSKEIYRFLSRPIMDVLPEGEEVEAPEEMLAPIQVTVRADEVEEEVSDASAEAR